MWRKKRTERVPTATLNKLVEYLQRVQPPPVYKSARPKIFYATQADVAPPVFVFFAKLAHAISPSYKRYLTNKIRETFGYEGVTFKLVFKDKNNKSPD
jgi:GTP-binding protein